MPIKTYGTSESLTAERRLANLVKTSPIPEDELIKNLGLFLTPGALGRIIYMSRLYERIVHQQGVILEFGCRFGQNTVLFGLLRGLFEPYNRLRKIVGFDTFEGFPSVDPRDGAQNKKHDYSTGSYSDKNLMEILKIAESFSPINHLEFTSEIFKGDVSLTVPDYFHRNPHTIVALCYFDLDIYKPTIDCLQAVEGYLSKGSILAFDELNDHDMPGETIALREFLGDHKVRIERDPISARTSFVVWG